MLNHKTYMDIQRMQVNYNNGFEKGDLIYIQEKIDGANASFQYDKETNSIIAFSRKQILTPINTLRGFYGWVNSLSVDLVREVLGDNLRMFCEWLVSHSVPYPQDKYNNAYCYDIFDTSNGTYLPQEQVKELVGRLGLIYVPVFYEGPFISWEHTLSFIGHTELGGQYGEGIVIKNMTKLNGNNTRLPFYVKIVGEKFQEVQKRREPKVISAEEMRAREENEALAKTIVTDARVRKILHKMVDEDILPEDWNENHMGVVAKNLTRLVYEDCIKEENDTVMQVEGFGKLANRISMSIAKDILVERQCNGGQMI